MRQWYFAAPLDWGTAAGRLRMGELFTPTHLIVLAVVAIVLFGGKKLPELGKGLGEGLRGFKEGVKGINEDANAAKTTESPKPGDSLKPPPAA